MADNTIALGIRPPALPDYNALTVQRANMMQGFAEQDAMRQQTANAMLRQQTQDARQVQQDQIAAQDRQTRIDVDARKLQETQAAAQQAQAKAKILNGAHSLLYTPLEQRVARFNAEIAPMLREMNVPEEVLAAAAADDALSNAEINQFIALFGGETVDPKNIIVGNRGYREDPVTKELTGIIDAPPAAPPSGYAQNPDGTYRAIVGGPADPRVIAGNRAPPSGGGAVPAQNAKAIQQTTARQNFSTLLNDVKSAYEDLDKLGAVTSSTKGTAGRNIIASAGASGPGQIASRVLGTRAQTLRDTITNAQFSLLNQIKNMEGIGARSLDSNVELKNALRSLADPTQSIESIRRTLGTIGRIYKAETGADLDLGGGAPAPAPAPGRGGGAAAPAGAAGRGGGVDASNPLLR